MFAQPALLRSQRLRRTALDVVYGRLPVSVVFQKLLYITLISTCAAASAQEAQEPQEPQEAPPAATDASEADMLASLIGDSAPDAAEEQPSLHLYGFADFGATKLFIKENELWTRIFSNN